MLGSIALTRTSKDLYADTKPLLNKYGACRVRVQQVCDRDNRGYYVLRYGQDFQLDSIPSHVPTLALTLHLERICYPAARVYHVVGELGDLFRNIVDRLEKPLRCHLTLDFDDLKVNSLYPSTVPRRYEAMKVLQSYQAVTVELSHGRWYYRNRARACYEEHARDYEAMFAKIKRMLTPNDVLDPRPKVTVFRTIRYHAEDDWVKYLEDKEEDECVAFKLPACKDRLSHDVRYCP